MTTVGIPITVELLTHQLIQIQTCTYQYYPHYKLSQSGLYYTNASGERQKPGYSYVNPPSSVSN